MQASAWPAEAAIWMKLFSIINRKDCTFKWKLNLRQKFSSFVLSQTVPRFECVGFSMYAWGFFVPQMRQFCLFTWKDDFFAKIGIFCMSIAGPLPSLVQSYTQQCSFGERIKLIFCQIRHELSVTIHEISISSERITLDGWICNIFIIKYKKHQLFVQIIA